MCVISTARCAETFLTSVTAVSFGDTRHPQGGAGSVDLGHQPHQTVLTELGMPVKCTNRSTVRMYQSAFLQLFNKRAMRSDRHFAVNTSLCLPRKNTLQLTTNGLPSIMNLLRLFAVTVGTSLFHLLAVTVGTSLLHLLAVTVGTSLLHLLAVTWCCYICQPPTAS